MLLRRVFARGAEAAALSLSEHALRHERNFNLLSASLVMWREASKFSKDRRRARVLGYTAEAASKFKALSLALLAWRCAGDKRRRRRLAVTWRTIG